jgi:hypothetical protein
MFTVLFQATSVSAPCARDIFSDLQLSSGLYTRQVTVLFYSTSSWFSYGAHARVTRPQGAAGHAPKSTVGGQECVELYLHIFMLQEQILVIFRTE